MGGHKSVRSSSYPSPTPKVADYHVTGTLSPDATCNYYYIGEFNDHPSYRRVDSAWFLWRAASDTAWLISDDLGLVGLYAWAREDMSILGDYQPVNEATGIATVSSGPH